MQKHIAVPFFWLGVVLVIGCLHACRLVSSNIATHGWLVFASVICSFSLFEVFLHYRFRTSAQSIAGPEEVIGAKPFKRWDSVAGVVLEPSSSFRAIRKTSDELIFDVVYSIDEHGFRSTPRQAGSDYEGCLLFFGCSTIFGLGLNDDETLPYFTNEALDFRYRVYNFGLSATGPNQTLALIESGRFEKSLRCGSKPVLAIHSSVDKAMRAAGKRDFSIKSPRYEMVGGEWQRSGNFNEVEVFGVRFVLPQPLLGLLFGSYSFSTVFLQTTKYDYERAIGLEMKSIRLLNSRRIQSFLFTHPEPGIEPFYEREKISRYDIEEILPERGDPLRYAIHKHDKHPNPLANRILGKFIAELVNKSSRSRDFQEKVPTP